ncbi:hypothetical protein CAPTEDRAFT_227174 [Capitella teleta]|uniref:Uncharacterized protein n=1 Tax=Capitella teleta TaxID=283909 RepID=R7UM84_CAPTE|nr:hypothetical protein CAPTEDRAFT_227174 [Capitella teleta]|eukprot:ELU07624.1 hypothetical protein CAPTEDRAFT_227174 [Capitella teleta]
MHGIDKILIFFNANTINDICPIMQINKVCGCTCPNCLSGISDSLDLHREIEELRSKVKKGGTQMTQMEKEFAQSKEFAEQEISKLQDELSKLRDRYDRLFDSHRKLQKINHNLEDKLLIMVDKYDSETSALQSEIANLNSKLLDAKVSICDLEEESDRYRIDCNIAVQLLQCKPSTFVAHKLNTLPVDLQERVKCHLTQEQITEMEDCNDSQNEPKMIRVPMPTFPPTAMVYSVNKTPAPKPPSDDDTVDSTIIAKVLSHSDPGRKKRRVFICSNCSLDVTLTDTGSQTELWNARVNEYHMKKSTTLEPNNLNEKKENPQNKQNPQQKTAKKNPKNYYIISR